MIGLDVEYNVLEPSYQYIRTKHNGDKILVYEKGDLLFVFNFHHSNSYENYDVYVKSCRKIKVIFSTDDLDFGGHGRVHHLEYDTTKVDDFCSKVKLYIPNRTAIVFKIII
jgi:1,4-alpha-glucan branching enzyme